MNNDATSTPAFKYRPDIDGLRAIAVLAVVGFHAGAPGMSEGFVGVDIFFVLSGYLISCLLIQAVERNEFSIASFYDRRIRRIFPALFCMFLVCFLVAAVYFLPGDMKEFGRSLASSSIFISNIMFQQQVGYFDGPSHEKPLLHTWSLSVEEQFYLLWPMLLWWLLKLRKREWSMVAVLIIAGVSLSLSVVEVNHSPSSAFYLLPYRAWELLLGALLAIGAAYRLRLSASVAQAVAIGGLSGIAYSIFTLSGADPFPGVNALPSCLGTAMLIMAGDGQTPVVNRFLSARPIVGVGLVSYSFYLWHWPALSFYRYVVGRELLASEVAAAVAVSFGAAILSWRFVERPFRMIHDRGASQRSRRLILGVASTLGCFGLGAALVMSAGWKARVEDQVAAIEEVAQRKHPASACALYPRLPGLEERCRIGIRKASPYQAVMFGDSHAQGFAAGADALFAKLGLTGSLVTQTGCPPLWGVTRMDDGKPRNCALSQSMDRFLADHTALQVVVLVARWALYTNESRPQGEEHPIKSVWLVDATNNLPSAASSLRALEGGLRRTVERLVDRGLEVVLVGQAPAFGNNPLRCVARVLRRGNAPQDCALSAVAVRTRNGDSDRLLTTLAARDHVSALLPTRILCDDSICSPIRDGQYLYQDDDHLNADGARYLAQQLWLASSELRQVAKGRGRGQWEAFGHSLR